MEGISPTGLLFFYLFRFFFLVIIFKKIGSHCLRCTKYDENQTLPSCYLTLAVYLASLYLFSFFFFFFFIIVAVVLISPGSNARFENIASSCNVDFKARLPNS